MKGQTARRRRGNCRLSWRLLPLWVGFCTITEDCCAIDDTKRVPSPLISSGRVPVGTLLTIGPSFDVNGCGATFL